MREIERFHQRGAAAFTRGKGLYDPGYLGGYLVGGGGLLDCIEQGLQHEFDKWCGIGPLISLGQHAIVVVLPLPDHCFHGQVSQKRFPRPQDQGLPQSTHAAVAIGKGVDEFKLVVKNATGHQEMLIGVL